MAQSCNFAWLVIIWCFVTLKAAGQKAVASADGIFQQMSAMINDPANTDAAPFLSGADMDNIETSLDNAQDHLDKANAIMKSLGDALIERRKTGKAVPVIS